MMKPIVGTLPSGKSFSVDLRLNHPTLLPGVQLLSEEVLLSGGKKLRPRLCFMVAEAIGVPFEKVAPYARVVELVHAATLYETDLAIAKRLWNKNFIGEFAAQTALFEPMEFLFQRPIP